LIDREAIMSNRTRTLVIGATLTAMHLAGMTAVAQAQANDQPARQPPTQGQVGESWHQRQVTAEQPNIASDARRPPTEAQVGESWRHPVNVPVQQVEPSGQSGWLIPAIGVLAALALCGGLAVTTTRRTRRRARVGHAA
jgi:hypothetical protein